MWQRGVRPGGLVARLRVPQMAIQARARQVSGSEISGKHAANQSSTSFAPHFNR